MEPEYLYRMLSECKRDDLMREAAEARLTQQALAEKPKYDRRLNPVLQFIRLLRKTRYAVGNHWLTSRSKTRLQSEHAQSSHPPQLTKEEKR